MHLQRSTELVYLHNKHGATRAPCAPTEDGVTMTEVWQNARSEQGGRVEGSLLGLQASQGTSSSPSPCAHQLIGSVTENDQSTQASQSGYEPWRWRHVALHARSLERYAALCANTNFRTAVTLPHAPFEGGSITDADFVKKIEPEMLRINQFTMGLVAGIRAQVQQLEADVGVFVHADRADESTRNQLTNTAVKQLGICARHIWFTGCVDEPFRPVGAICQHQLYWVPEDIKEARQACTTFR